MGRVFFALVAVLTIITLTRAEVVAAAESVQAGALKELPEDWVIYDQAPTLAALIDKTRPAFHFDDGVHGTILVWTGTDAVRRRFFRLAAARLLTAKNAKPTWIITSVGNGVGPFADDPLPRTNIVVGKDAPALFEGDREPKEVGMGTVNGAREVLSSGVYGTLYEIECYYSLSGEGGTGLRLIVLRDRTGSWKLVAKLDSDYWDDTGFMEGSAISARWTGVAEAPVRLREVTQLRSGDPMSEVRDVAWEVVSTYEGRLPMIEPRATRCYVVVAKGNTFSWIIRQIVEEDMRGDSEALQKKVGDMFSREIGRLNPQLDESRLRIGQRIEVPSMERREGMIKKAM